MLFEMADCYAHINDYLLYLPKSKTICLTFTNNQFDKVKIKDKVVPVLTLLSTTP
jgi:hypothetical protein